ncbi:MAG TPA: pitrilysin family protein [Ignavibacteriaceae bacterium]|jgi:predicted Zn-dependent peptidase|nr:MAG: Peptidase M16 inactive domain protein [Ignavibacteria bacterium ADurb.Bin266]HQI40669.1 pitrilysin family protein [Ignavibacteriaceae bacterium]HQJ46682.1 pitrilysin family protein [Ignavibacteriaceae bacterium]
MKSTSNYLFRSMRKNKSVKISSFIYSLKITLLLLLLLSISCYSQFKLPNYEIVQLDNGLTVYLMEKKNVPIVSISVVIEAGAIKDGELNGIASFTAEALKFGTKNHTKNQIDSLFNFYGSSLNTYSRADYSGISTQFMKEHLLTLLPVLAEVIKAPTFAEEEIVKRKQRWIAELDQAKESPRQVIGSYFNKLLFNDSPYGNPVNGTKKSIEQIDRAKAVDFYQKNFRPENCAIAVVGDFNSNEMKNQLINFFGNWSTTASKIIYDVRSYQKELKESVVYLINKENARETTFMIGGFGVPMSNPDRTQIDVVNTILGGRFTSWLNDELRVNAGYTYGAGSRFASYKTAGTFFISTFTANKFTEPAIELALKTYNRLFENGIDEKTLSSAKSYIKGQFPPRYETSDLLAGFLTQKFIYGLDDSYINGFEKAVDEMTVEKASQIIKRYFPKDNLQFVLIGKADEIRDIAKKYGKVIEKNITEDGF